jgi:hypothetical protein
MKGFGVLLSGEWRVDDAEFVRASSHLLGQTGVEQVEERVKPGKVWA